MRGTVASILLTNKLRRKMDTSYVFIMSYALNKTTSSAKLVVVFLFLLSTAFSSRLGHL